MPKTETTHLLITQAVLQLKATATALAELKKEMLRLAELLPEFPVVQKMLPESGSDHFFTSGHSLRFYLFLQPSVFLIHIVHGAF